MLRAWELAGDKTGGYLYSRALLALISAVFHWIVFQSRRHRRAGRAGPVGRHRQPVPARRRHVPRRRPAGAADVPRLAAQGGDRAHRHRRLPADRELPVLAAHHGPHDGAAPGAGVRRRARRGGRARRGRCRARAAGGGDGARRSSATGAIATRSIKSDLDRGPPPRGSGSGGRRSAGPASDALDAAFVPVAVTTRSGVDESVHHGAVVALGARRRGRVGRRRSRRRGLPALGAQAAAGGGDGRRRARRSTTGCWPSCAPATTGAPSTSPRSREILAGAGLDEADLDNTPTLPLDADAMRRRRARRRRPGVDPPELQRQACGDAGDGGRQRLADGRVPSTRPSRAAADPRRPRARAPGAVDARRRRRVRRAGAGRVAASGWPGRCAGWPSTGTPVHRAMTGHPGDGRRPDARRHAADAARARAAGQGRRRGRAGRRAARRAGRRRQDRRRRRAGADAGDGRRAAVARCRRRRRRRSPSRSSATASPVGRGRARWSGRRERGPEFRPLDDVVYGRVEQVAPMLRRVDRREPVEVHVPRHRHLHRRRGRGRRRRSRPDARLPPRRARRGARRRAGDGDLRHPLPQRPLAAGRVAARPRPARRRTPSVRTRRPTPATRTSSTRRSPRA